MCCPQRVNAKEPSRLMRLTEIYAESIQKADSHRSQPYFILNYCWGIVPITHSSGTSAI